MKEENVLKSLAHLSKSFVFNFNLTIDLGFNILSKFKTISNKFQNSYNNIIG